MSFVLILIISTFFSYVFIVKISVPFPQLSQSGYHCIDPLIGFWTALQWSLVVCWGEGKSVTLTEMGLYQLERHVMLLPGTYAA